MSKRERDETAEEAPGPLAPPPSPANQEPLELPKMTRTYNGEPQTTWAFDSLAPAPAAPSGVLVPKDVVEAKGGPEAVKKIISDAVAAVAPGLTVEVGLTHVPAEEDNLAPLQKLVHEIDAHTEWTCKLERDGACPKKIEQEVCNLILLLVKGDKFEEEAGTHPVNLAAVADVRPLHTAAGSGAPRTLEALLAFEKTDLGVKNCFKQTPLKRLVGYGSNQKGARECVDLFVDAMLKREETAAAELDKEMDVPLAELAKARAKGTNLYNLLVATHRAKLAKLQAEEEEDDTNDAGVDPDNSNPEPPQLMDALAKKTHPMPVENEFANTRKDPAQPLTAEAVIATFPIVPEE